MKFIITLLFRLLSNHVPVEQQEMNKIQGEAEAWVGKITADKPMLWKLLGWCDQWYVKLAACIVYIRMMRLIPLWMNPELDKKREEEEED